MKSHITTVIADSAGDEVTLIRQRGDGTSYTNRTYIWPSWASIERLRRLTSRMWPAGYAAGDTYYRR